jgi:hypothetical protein
MNKHLFTLLGLILLFIVGITPVSIAQESRTFLVVDPYGKAFYSADDMNQLQSVLLPFRKQYGIAVQGFDKDLGGYVIFSSQTKLSELGKTEMESLRSAITDAYPTAVITLKQQSMTVNNAQQGKLPSAQPQK